MATIGKNIFWQGDARAIALYNEGMQALTIGALKVAEGHWSEAAALGHPSAKYNLSMLHGGAKLTPVDIDAAVETFREAAALGHQGAIDTAHFIEKADDTSFGTLPLAAWAQRMCVDDSPHPLIIMTACRLFAAMGKQYEVLDAVAAAAIEDAASSHIVAVRRFAERSGVTANDYQGSNALVRLDYAADQTSNGLRQLRHGLLQGGVPEHEAEFAICTVVAYMISKSRFAPAAGRFCGRDTFFLYE